MDDKRLVEFAGEVFDIEINAIRQTRARLGESFVKAVRLIIERKGKVVTSGVGKSGIVARKIAATLASTGTQAIFLHPVEGIHGDLGMVSASDVGLFISKSGRTEELVKLAPSLRKAGVPIISISMDTESPLAKESDLVLQIAIEREACPMNLAPTSSTTATLVLGDALAAALLEVRGFKKEDFAIFHPGGSLGRRLTLRVADVMHSGEENPLIGPEASMSEAILEMTSKGMGAVNVVDGDGRQAGIITDGDLRRAVIKYPNLLQMQAKELMTKNPVSVKSGDMAVDAMILMEDRPSQIYVLPVEDDDGKIVGIIRLHDLVRAGL
jgi:arabinose-5-phosphate isomerase